MKSAVSLATSFNESLEKEQKELDKLFGELEGATEGTKEYLKAKDRLLRQYGSYLEGLVTEEGKIIDLEKAYKRLSEAIRIANEERGIKEARDAVDDAYYNQMKELQAQLSASLTAYGADTREAARLAMQVSTAMSANRALSQDVIDRINELSKNAPSSEAAEGWWNSFWSHLSPNAQNSTIGQIFNVDQVLQPAELVNRMYSAQDVRKTSLNEIDIIEREQRPLGGLEDNMLECLISYAQKAVDNGGGNVISVDNALSGVFEVSKATASEAKELLEQLKGEQAYRSGKAASSGDGTNPEVTIPTAPDPDKNGDRFAAEKAWKEKEEALSRIAYAKGEKSHSEHNARMLEIATDYNQMLLDRTDLTAEERLSIQADYWEAVNKENTAKSKELIEEESISYESLKSQITKNYIDRLKTENLSAEERSNADKVHKEALELAELNHLARMVELYEEGSAERLKAQQAYQNAQLKAAQRHQQEYEKQEAEFAKLKSKYFGNNPSEDKAAYDKQIAALQVVYNRELKAAGDNAEERLRIEEAFQKAKQALALQYNQASEVDTRNSMEKAVASSVEWLNSDGGKAVTGAISTLTSGMSSIFSGLSSMIQAELTIETAAIEKRYEREVALAQGNSYKVAKAEKQKEADIAKAKNDANKKMFAMQVIQAVAQTATNALNAYGSAAAVPVIGYILAPIAAAMAVAAGAIQIASIKKQAQASEAQGYAEGGFTRPGGKYEPAGVVHAGEWVASQKLLASPVARPLINALDYAQRTNTIGSLNSEDVSSSITASNSLARIADSGASGAMVVAALSRFAEVGERLNNRLDEPFTTVNTVTGDYGIKKAEDEYARLINNKTPKSKR